MLFPKAVVLATTATADSQVAEKIRAALDIQSVIIDATERENLTVVDRRGIKERERYTASIIAAGAKTLVYVNTRDEALQLTRTMRKLVPSMGHRIVFYHAGLTKEDRLTIENALREHEASCVICTSAFGEGVNIPDIRNIIHYHLPFSTIDFNQMSGRAGRDGLKADIHLVFNSHDCARTSQILTAQAPSREELGIVWRACKKMGYDCIKVQKSTVSPADIDENDLEDLIEKCVSFKRSFGLDKKGVQTAIAIFLDLGLVRFDEQSGIRHLVILEPNEKADLQKSARYVEGLSENAAYGEFQDWVMRADTEEIRTRLNRPLMPECGY